MKRRAPQTTVASDAIPVELRAGACIEVWSPVALDWWEAKRRYWEARSTFLAGLGVATDDHYSLVPQELRITGRPWSFRSLAEHDPERLADKLEYLGLPADWIPSRVTP